jgi:hypothetical protein
MGLIIAIDGSSFAEAVGKRHTDCVSPRLEAGGTSNSERSRHYARSSISSAGGHCSVASGMPVQFA